MGDTDSDSFQSADEEDLSVGRRSEASSTKNEKELDNLRETSATFEHIESKIGKLETGETVDDASVARKSFEDDDNVLKELERPWIEEGMGVSARKAAVHEIDFEATVSSCSCHPDTECHCKRDEFDKMFVQQASIVSNTAAQVGFIENETWNFANMAANAEPIDNKTPNVANMAAKAEQIDNKTPNIEQVENKTPNIEQVENKTPNVVNMAAKAEQIDNKMPNVEKKTSNFEKKTSNFEKKTSNIEKKTSNIEKKTSNIEKKPSNIEKKTPNVEQIEKKATNVEQVEKMTPNVEQIEKKATNVEPVEKKLPNVEQEDNKPLNVENVRSSSESIQTSQSEVMEMTDDSSRPAQKGAGPWGWSTWGTSMLNTAAQSGTTWGSSMLNTAAQSGTTWGSSMLNTAAQSGTTWGSSLLNTATASGSVWGTQLLNTATTSGSVWGTQLLNTASSSVSTFTSQVGEGLNSVLQTVESTFGAPSPEELAAQVIQEDRDRISEEDILDDVPNSDENSFVPDDKTTAGLKSPVSDEKLTEDRSVIPEELQFIGRGLLSTVSTVTTAIESTSTKVIKGSLDTLEMIGKKTMDVIQDGDPGLKNTRAAVRKSTLSEVLREAKKKSETEEETSNMVKEPVRKVNYTTLFDEYQGLISLEALELVSKNCEAKVTSILAHIDEAAAKEDMESRLAAISDICVTEECEDDSSDDSNEDVTEVVLDRLKTLGDTVPFSRLDEVYQKGDKLVAKWGEGGEDASLNMSIVNFYEHYGEAVKLLAEITARAVELYHKMAEMLLLPQKLAAGEAARCLTDFTFSLNFKVNYFAAKFSECHQYNYEKFGAEHKETVNEFITNVFLESSNSCSYIQDSSRLVVPVLQLKVATDIRERI